MFRELTRKKQQLPKSVCVEILRQEKRGVLSVCGEEGYPYGVPMNYWYCEEDGRLYFHSGPKGHKLDALRRCDKASFCVYDSGCRIPGEWALQIQSVIVFGRVEFVEEHQRAMEITRSLSLKFTQDTAYIDAEIAAYGAGTVVFSLVPEHMTGKTVSEK